ncbi:hypothetical protein [Clostridium lacusfryxellense]|uniref:hypothetical protein n=1 Tax=Clostridium lacusfryxellense TaxID=205328 RepID=UPI001C0C5C6F|nr:hypothetical protein [Clostridium lacusfryxellense]MBU3112947.1 hypothetical protein [Clostridium lacusfryxellense]
MKSGKSYKTLSKNKHVKSLPTLMVNKLLMLLGAIIPISMFVAYAMKENFFYVTIILSIFVLIISVAAYLKGEIIYYRPKVVHHGNVLKNKKNVINETSNKKFSLSLSNGTVQVMFSIIIIILMAGVGQAIYKVIG